MRNLLAAAFALLLGGCQFLTPRISSGKTTVTSTRDAGKPATLNTNFSDESLVIPENSLVKVTRYQPQSYVAATESAPSRPASAGYEVTEIVPSHPTVLKKHAELTDASTGTVDTSIAKHRIDAEQSKPLLYVAIACAIAAGVFVYIKYPTPAMCAAGASIVFFLAWKLSDLPDWFYLVGVAAIVGGIFLYIGHEKGQKNADPANASPNPPK